MAGYDLQVKLLMIGDSGVGKTSLLGRFSHNSFSLDAISTIGVDFKIKTLHLRGKIIKLQIWDTSGQERFRSITSSYYRGAQGILLVYDIQSRHTFGEIRHWMSQIQQYADSKINMILIGNKCDSPVNLREVSVEDGEALAKNYNMPFFETSAKSNINVEEAYTSITNAVVERVLEEMDVTMFGEKANRRGNNTVNVNNGNDKQGKRSGCC